MHAEARTRQAHCVQYLWDGFSHGKKTAAPPTTVPSSASANVCDSVKHIVWTTRGEALILRRGVGLNVDSTVSYLGRDVKHLRRCPGVAASSTIFVDVASVRYRRTPRNVSIARVCENTYHACVVKHLSGVRPGEAVPGCTA